MARFSGRAWRFGPVGPDLSDGSRRRSGTAGPVSRGHERGHEKGGPPKGPALVPLDSPVSYRTILRASRPPATSRAPAPSAMTEAPPVLGQRGRGSGGSGATTSSGGGSGGGVSGGGRRGVVLNHDFDVVVVGVDLAEARVHLLLGNAQGPARCRRRRRCRHRSRRPRRHRTAPGQRQRPGPENSRCTRHQRPHQPPARTPGRRQP